MNKTIPFVGFDAHVRITTYQAGPIAILLVAAPTERNQEQDCFPGEPIATASVMLGEPLLPGETFIKTWSENSGLLEILVANGIITPTGRFSQSNCNAPVVKVHLDVAEQFSPKQVNGTF